jgi:hypothetical protein
MMRHRAPEAFRLFAISQLPIFSASAEFSPLSLRRRFAWLLHYCRHAFAAFRLSPYLCAAYAFAAIIFHFN